MIDKEMKEKQKSRIKRRRITSEIIFNINAKLSIIIKNIHYNRYIIG